MKRNELFPEMKKPVKNLKHLPYSISGLGEDSFQTVFPDFVLILFASTSLCNYRMTSLG